MSARADPQSKRGLCVVMPSTAHWTVPPVVRRNGHRRLTVTCACPGHRYPPLRLVPAALVWLRDALGGRHPPPNMVVQTYRCGDCGAVVEITVADMLALAPSATRASAL